MFDIDNAVKTAFEGSGPAARMALAQFLRRSARHDTPTTQWRAYGKESEAIAKFLTALGFEAGSDYEIYFSQLDSRITDFRWGGDSDRFRRLRGTLASAESKAATDGRMSPTAELIGACVTGAGPTGGFNSCAPCSEERPAVVWPHRIEDRAKDMIERVSALASVLLEEGNVNCPWITAAVDPELGATYNGVAKSRLNELKEANMHWAAIPDLWFVEAAMRLLDPASTGFDCANTPTTALFGPVTACDPSNHFTLARYVSRNDSIPGIDVLLSGVAAQDMHNPARSENNGETVRDVCPLNAFFTNRRASLEHVPLSGKDGVFVVTTGAFDRCNRARTVAYAADPKTLWTYIQSLYTAFFGMRVGIEPHARVASGPSNGVWQDMYGTWSPVLETQLGVDRNLCLTFAFIVSPAGTNPSAGWDANLAPSSKPIKILSRDELVDSSAFRDRAVTWEEWPALWYSYIHHSGNDINKRNSIFSDFYGHREPKVLDKFRSRYRHRRITPTMLLAESKYSPTSDLAPEITRHGTCDYTPASAFLSGVASAVKRAVRTGELVPCTHPDTDLHPGTTVVSNVYSGVGGEGTLMDEFEDAEANGRFDEWRDRFACSQLAVPEAYPPSCPLVALVETNIAATSVSVSHELIGNLKNVVWSTLGQYESDPEAYGSPHERDAWGHDTMCRHFGEVPVSTLEEQGPVLTRGSEYADDRIEVRLIADAHGRLNIMFKIRFQASRYMLTKFRFHTGLPVPDAVMWSAAPSAANGVPRVGPEGYCSDQLYSSVVRTLVDRYRDDATINVWSTFSRWPKFGFGPLHSPIHKWNELVSLGRQRYLEGTMLDLSAVLA